MSTIFIMTVGVGAGMGPEPRLERNVGGLDRAVRLVAGAMLIAVGGGVFAGHFGRGLGFVPYGAATLAIVAGTVLLFTGVIARSRLNRLVGIDTRSGETRNERRPRHAD